MPPSPLLLARMMRVTYLSETMIITGTRKGIGRYLVDYYLEKGFQIYGCSRQEMEEEIEGYTARINRGL